LKNAKVFFYRVLGQPA